jgi:hypothetical protein
LIRYFRINDPYRLVGLLVLMVAIYLPFFIDSPALTIPELKSMIIGEKVHEGLSPYSELIESTAPLTSWIYAFFDMIFGRSLLARHIVAFLIIFSQSLYLGIMFINKKVFTENTFIPSVLFSVLFFFSFDTLALTGELLASGFLLLALNCLFREIEFKVQRNETVFNLGLFIALASLCSFATSIYLLASLGILAFYTRSTPRKYILMIFGYVLPHALVMSVYYLSGNLDALWSYYYVPNMDMPPAGLVSVKTLLVLSAIPLFYMVVSVVILNREARFSKYQSQLLQAMFLWMMSSFPQIAFSRDLRPQNLIVLIPCLAYFITHLLLLIRRRRFAEINFWVLTLGIVLVAYLSRYNKITSVDYSGLLVAKAAPVKDKKILLLGEGIHVYRTNELGSGFFDWSLSQKIFRDPDYYDNVMVVYEAFKNDPPDVIIDRENLMAGFLKRLPDLNKDYEKTGADTYTRKR